MVIMWIICSILYVVAQGLAYFFVLFNKEYANKAPVPCACEKHEEEKPQEEPKEEPKASVAQEPAKEPEEPKQEPKEEEKVEEPVAEEPAEEEAEESEESETPVVSEDGEGEEKAPRVKVTFEERLSKADPALIDKYHEIRDEIMSYGVKSRVSSSGDTFRLHTVKYMKIVVAGKKLKLYMRLNPKAYDGTTIPHLDASNKQLYTEIPMVFKVSSDLSVKRAKGLIEDMMKENGIEKKRSRKKKEQ